MTRILGAKGRGRVVFFFIGIVLSTYAYLSAGKGLFLTHINQLSIEVERRIQWWDWNDTPEEMFCRAPHHPVISKGSIPKVVHFVLLAPEGKKFKLSYARFLAIKAAVLRMEGAEIKIHTSGLDTSNTWWKAIEKHVTLVTVDSDQMHASYGLPWTGLRLPHQADILRLAILQREGGIYMDTDVYTLKPFTDLLSNPRDVVMGHEGGNRYGLCNAIIVARAGSTFMAKWQESYKTFNPKTWNEHSVRIPKRLQMQYPSLACPLSPTVFFWPTWATSHVRYMHESITSDEVTSLRLNMTTFGGVMYENQLAFHAVAAKDYLETLTPEDVLGRDTRFNILLRDISTASL